MEIENPDKTWREIAFFFLPGNIGMGPRENGDQVRYTPQTQEFQPILGARGMFCTSGWKLFAPFDGFFLDMNESGYL